MAVVVETTLGDITIDLFIEERPTTCMNFLKLCKIKYYNFCLFHSIQQNFIAQTGDPSGSGRGGSSIFYHTQGNSSNYYEAEKLPKIKHTNIGTVSMVNCGNHMLGSQFFITLGKDLQSLDGEHCVFGEVTEGHDILRKFNEVICDQGHRPYQDIRITHTVILEDPFDDPPGLKLPDSSPELTKEVLANSRIAPDEEIDETAGLTAEEVEELQRKREALAQATILEIVGDLPDADVAPPENVLFVCKLNPVTTDDDLEIIFSRFGKIVSCEVIRDKNTGDSLQYAFVEFDNRKACEDAYFKMDNVLIDDRRIHVDFSQSVSKLRWKGKGRLEHLDDAKSRPDYANYDRISEVKVRLSPDSSRQRGGETDSCANNRNSNRRENDRSSKVSRENNLWRHDGRHDRSNERHSRIYSESVRDRYYRPREAHERYRSEVNRESNYRNKHKYYERDRYRNERRKDMYYREDKYRKKSKSESSDSEEKVSTNRDSQNRGICRKMQNEIHNEKLNYVEKEKVKQKYDDSGDKVEVKKLYQDKKSAKKYSASSETEDESGSSADQGMERERERSSSKLRQREASCEEIKTRDKKHKRQSSCEKNSAQLSVMKKEKRKRKDSGSDGEKHLNIEDRVGKRKVKPDDHENKGSKTEKEEKLSKMKSASNSSYEKEQKQDKYKQNRKEIMVGSGSEVAKDASRGQERKKNRRNSSDSNESIHKSPITRDTVKKDKKRERNNSTSTDHRSSSSKRKSDTRDDSESDEQTIVKKSKVVKNKYDSTRHVRRNLIKGKNKKQLKKREMVRKKKKRRDKRNKSSSSSRSSDSGSETISSSSTSSSSSSSSTSSSESSDSSSSPSSSTSSSSSDDNHRRKRRKKVSKVNAVKKTKRGTVPKKTKKEHRKLTDVSEEDSRKVKGKVQKKKSESVGKNNIEKRVKIKSHSKKKRVTHSSDSSSESDSSEDSIRDSKRRKRIRK